LEELGATSVALSAGQQALRAALLQDRVAELGDALVCRDPVVVAGSED
jgi:hypothetical protein